MELNNLRYAGIAYDDVVNGEGLGAVFFTQYCPHKCKHCQNPSTWSKDGGLEFDISVVDELMAYYRNTPFATRLTISGGEPLTEFSADIVFYLIHRFKAEFPDKKIWLYTGHYFEYLLYAKDISQYVLDKEIMMIMDVLRCCDVIVDGRYDYTRRDVTLAWCGSSNQRVIDVQKSLEADEVVLYE